MAYAQEIHRKEEPEISVIPATRKNGRPIEGGGEAWRTG